MFADTTNQLTTIQDQDIQLIIHHIPTDLIQRIITAVEARPAHHTAIQVAADILVTAVHPILPVEVSIPEEAHHSAAHQEVPVQEDTKAIQPERFFMS